MGDLTRRGLFSLLSGAGGAALVGGNISIAEAASPTTKKLATIGYGGGARFAAMRRALEREMTEEQFRSWFNALDFVEYRSGVLTVSVPVKFLKKWIDAHYPLELQRAARSAYPWVESVELVVHYGPFAPEVKAYWTDRRA